MTDPAVTPDGRAVTITVTRVDVDANRYRSAIWLVPTSPDEGPAVPLTAGRESDAGARWSPDGRRIAFTRSERRGDGAGDAVTSLLVLAVDGPGEPVCVMSSSDELSAVDWSPDGERLTWCARVPGPDAGAPDRDRPPRRITALRTRLDDQGWIVDRPTQVFVGRVDGTEAPRQITAGAFEHTGPRWSPDGRSIVLCAARHEGWDLEVGQDLHLADPDGSAADLRRLTEDGRWLRLPSWSPDGSRIAVLAGDEREGWRNPRAVVVDIATGADTDAAPGVDRSFAPFPGERAPVWLDERSFLAGREDRGRVGVLCLSADGSSAPEEIETGECCVTGFDAAGGTFAMTVATATQPAELHIGGVPRTTATAAFLRACPPLAVERFAVPSPAGDGDVDAWFVAPDAAGPWPLIVSVHGGPATQYAERWFDEWQLWASAGFAVVGCNPHGSSGREEAWGRAIRSPLSKLDPGTGWGGIDADDVLAVLDDALARWPRLDAARVGVHGGSYGGYMTSWLCARTDRFAAGCSERAVNNLLSEEWSCDLAGTFWRDLGVSHLEHPDEYLRMSPATYVADITCSMLILHSENDLRCNIEQADALFVPLRMLQRDVEYWRFPGEGHELSRSGSPKHRIRRAELIIDFFRRTLAP